MVTRTKISKLDNNPNYTGSEVIPLAHNSRDQKISTEQIFTLTPTVGKNSSSLGSVDNTADANKPVSVLQQLALDTKQDIGVAAELKFSLTNLTNVGFTAGTIDLTFSVDSKKGYSLPSLTFVVQYMRPAVDTAWTDGTSVAFVEGTVNYSVTQLNLIDSTAYSVRIKAVDENNPNLNVVSSSIDFTTASSAADSDSNFDIVASTYINGNVFGVNATIDDVANVGTATADLASVQSVELEQQVNEANFNSIVPGASFRPKKLAIDPTSTPNSLVLDITGTSLSITDSLYLNFASGVVKVGIGSISVNGTVATVSPFPAQTYVPIAAYKAGQKLKAYVSPTSKTSVTPGNSSLTSPGFVNKDKVSTTKDITTWTAGLPVPESNNSTQVVVHENFAYFIGNTYGVVGSIYNAPIDSSGVLGQWTKVISVDTIDPIYGFNGGTVLNGYLVNILSYNGFMYAIGTVSGGTYMHVAPINPDGSLGTWTKVADSSGTAAVTIPVALRFDPQQIVFTNTRMHFIIASQWATINADGTIGALQAEINAHPFSTVNGTYSGVFSNDSFVYTIGGWSGSGNDVGTIYRAKIDLDESLGPWSSVGVLPFPGDGFSVAATKDTLFILAGWNNLLSGGLANLYFAPINADGTIGLFTMGSALPASYDSTQVLVTLSRIYMISGSTDQVDNTTDTFYAPFDGWSLQPITNLPPESAYTEVQAAVTVITGDTVTVTGNKLYKTGRYTSVLLDMNVGDVNTELKGDLTLG